MRISDWSSDVCSSDLSSARLAAFAIDWPSAALGPVLGTSTATFWLSAASGPVGFSTGLGGPACPGLASRPPGVHAARIENTARVAIVRAESHFRIRCGCAINELPFYESDIRPKARSLHCRNPDRQPGGAFQIGRASCRERVCPYV